MEQSPVSLLLHFASEAPLAVPGRRRSTRKAAMNSSPVIVDLDRDDEKNIENFQSPQTNEKTHEEEAEATEEPKYKCPICMCAYIVPTTLKACGHVFCGSCIAQALKGKKECPICRTRATKRHLLEIYLSN
ncbi:RING-type domain-containing protein [Heracleum sosnowskyi]|uniref:RING-type domain-containing protein n=1 Tax=Heracleum sosnowskyi TaxID=360622 RepID=A0AAD8MC43_9APIA|nr:RING-type domain-containing protein [Heracleum sosnowskyi]